MAVTQGSFTVGSGGDYATWYEAAIDCASQTLTGDLTFTQISDLTLTTDAFFNGLDVNGYTLEITSNSPHNGDPESGWKTFVGYGAIFDIYNPTGPTGSIDVNGLVLKTTTTNLGDEVLNVQNTAGGAVGSILVHDIIIDGRSVTLSPNYNYCYVYCGVTGQTIKMFNVKGVHCRSNNRAGIWAYNVALLSRIILENCSCQQTPGASSGNGFQLYQTSGEIVMRNCAALGFAGRGFYNSVVGSVVYNCMSDDGTAITPGGGAWGAYYDCIINVTPADEFTSLDPATGGLAYLEPKSTGQAAHLGTATYITENDHGAILTVARPHKLVGVDKYSIGANEFPSEPTITADPALQRVDENDPATFSITALNATSYQWQDAPPPAPGGSPSFSDMVGETASTLLISSAGSGLHQYQYRCRAINALGSATSEAAYLLINGLPDPGAPPAASPDRPLVTIVGIEDNVITLNVAGVADLFRAELTDGLGNIVSYMERNDPGELTVTAPSRGVRYALAVIAANVQSPATWSLPGYTGGILVSPDAPETGDEEGVGLVSMPSTLAEQAGPMGAGLSFPFRFSDTTGAPEVSYGMDHVTDGMQQILVTKTGDRVIRRNFGSPLAGRIMRPDTEIGPEVSAEIQDALARNEHRAEVSRVVLTRNRLAGAIIADIYFTVFLTHQRGNLVYPFSLSE